MILQWCKVLCSALVSALAVLLFVRRGGTERRWCMAAMILSTCGDVFMTDVLRLGAVSTYPGAAFFILSHITYAVCFLRAGKRQGLRLLNKGFFVGLCLTLATAGVLTGAMLLRTGEVQGMYLPLLGYLAFIGWNVVSQFSYGTARGGKCRLLPLGMTLFLLSDFLVFLPMLNVCPEPVLYDIVIWILYLPAQILIVTCSEE